MENLMRRDPVPEYTFRRLSERAAALNISVNHLVKPVRDWLAEAGIPAPEPPLHLTVDPWRAELGP